MPYSFIFTDEELCDLWSYYRRIAQIIRCVEERHSLVITDSEVHAGAHFRARPARRSSTSRVVARQRPHAEIGTITSNLSHRG